MHSLTKYLPGLGAALLLITGQQHVRAEDDFAKWKQEYQSSFQEYKDKRDREFTAFLKTQWREMKLLQGVELDPTPKPVVMPVAEPLPVPPPEPVVRLPAAEPEPQQPPVIERKPEPVVIQPLPVPEVRPALPPEPGVVQKGQKLVVSYLGGRHTFYYDPKLKIVIKPRINEKAVSEFWSALSLADYDDLLQQINKKSNALQLNDWAHALLVHHIAREIYPASESSQSLFTWFMLAKDGYQARIAYNDREVFLLVPSQQPLYAVPYFTFERLRYYAVRFDGKNQHLGQVYTYDGNYPGANKALDMRLNNEALTGGNAVGRDLSFDFAGRRYAIHAAYDDERIRFMDTYPQLDLQWYFKGRVSAVTSTPLQRQLSDYMKGMDEQTAVNFLLRFVQTALRYKTDDVQFGKENYLFPEETLHYPYSDCEDRSILFAWLVHSLLGMDVVGLDYPGHVATAVLFKEQVKGDAVMHNGKRYIVADPTYINASVGMTMPDFKNAKPGVITIR